MKPRDDELRRLYVDISTVAVVGASDDPSKPGWFVPRYLRAVGFRIVPVNPAHETVLGERSYPSLRDVDVPVDIVDVFRPSEEAPAIAADAVAIGARYLWLQFDIVSEEAARIAEEGGLTVVMDECLALTHGELGLGPPLHPDGTLQSLWPPREAG